MYEPRFPQVRLLLETLPLSHTCRFTGLNTGPGIRRPLMSGREGRRVWCCLRQFSHSPLAQESERKRSNHYVVIESRNSSATSGAIPSCINCRTATRLRTSVSRLTSPSSTRPASSKDA
jgi:hypothetical protein